MMTFKKQYHWEELDALSMKRKGIILIVSETLLCVLNDESMNPYACPG